MTSEERLDRLERITKLIVRAGLRERRETREKINALIDANLRTEATVAKLAEAQQQTQADLSALTHIAGETDKRLDRLADLVERHVSGNGHHDQSVTDGGESGGTKGT